MSQFVIVYLGGNPPATPEEGKAHFAKYQAWLGEMGDDVVSPMNPFKGTTTVNSDGSLTSGSKTAMSGYTIIDVDTMDEAVAFCKSCPFLDIGGTLEISELVQMPG